MEFVDDASPGMQRQLEIYLKGLLGGTGPELPVSPQKLRAAAEEAMSDEAYGYVAGAAGSEDTPRANREAFRRWRIVPRFMRDVANRDLSVDLWGRTLEAPIILAPIGVQGIIHEDGEMATARAAAQQNLPFVLSTVSSYSIEEVAEARDEAPQWFQLYWPKDFDLAASLVERAEAAGYEALVVTLDTHLLSWRDRDLTHAYLPFLQGQGLANYLSDPVFREALPAPPEEDQMAAIQHFASIFSNARLTWDDLAFLRAHTDLPILLKGILHPDDARKAVDHGADGLIVSNHGGRQMDGALAALEALPAIDEAVGEAVPLLFDSGIRRGADVLKALALGAQAVLLGRPYCYGLALQGQAGVEAVVENLVAELDLTLGLAGQRSVEEVGRDLLVDREGGNAADQLADRKGA